MMKANFVIQGVLGLFSIVLLLIISGNILQSTNFSSKLLCKSSNEIRETIYDQGVKTINEEVKFYHLVNKKSVKKAFRGYLKDVFGVNCPIQERTIEQDWRMETRNVGSTDVFSAFTGVKVFENTQTSVRINSIEQFYGKGKIAYFNDYGLIITKPGTSITNEEINSNQYQIITGSGNDNPVDFFKQIADHMYECNSVFLAGTQDPLFYLDEPNPYTCNLDYIKISINPEGDEKQVTNITVGDLYDFLAKTKKNSKQTYLDSMGTAIKFCFMTNKCAFTRDLTYYWVFSNEEEKSFDDTVKVCVPLIGPETGELDISGSISKNSYTLTVNNVPVYWQSVESKYFCSEKVLDEVFNKPIMNEEYLMIGYQDEYKDFEGQNDVDQQFWENCQNAFVIPRNAIQSNINELIKEDGVILCQKE